MDLNKKIFSIKKELMNEKYEHLKTARDIYNKGKTDTSFDYKRGQVALQKKDKTGKWTFEAGKNWKEFDHQKGYDFLKKFHDDKLGKSDLDLWFYKQAKKEWPEKDKNDLSKTSEKQDLKKLSSPEILEEVRSDISSVGASKGYDIKKVAKIFRDRNSVKYLHGLAMTLYRADKLTLKYKDLIKKYTGEVGESFDVQKIENLRHFN